MLRLFLFATALAVYGECAKCYDETQIEKINPCVEPEKSTTNVQDCPTATGVKHFISHKVSNDRTTVKGCNTRVNSTFCEDFKRSLPQMIVDCTICTKDGCNSGPIAKPSIFLLAIFASGYLLFK